MSNQNLSGRTAVVTGSTSGIGAATAHALAARGARVVVTGRDATRGADVVAGIESRGGSALFVAGDLAASPVALRELAASWSAALDGRVDILVHNAAVCPAVDTVSLSDADLETTLAVNVRAPQVLTAVLAPAMAANGSGAIVVIGSWMATVGHAFVGFYSATKAAEAQLARSWAAEFGPSGVRVNTVAPGATRTPINEGSDDVITRMTATIPAGRPGRPEEIAEAVAWVVSDDASYLHGALIPLDGGITATR
ncbi:SDR family NAD(P)-dependent oxidoreductase [Nocardioides sp. URHA0020]|uniref:SDR family NAD(P)-dependent oxidoreductase n=1 Tax=Nocardioides sp. URHA0020 TaxID=1380392 RepID=UPI00048B85E5|nr:SDR family oxidoreductase [Nocardioides sp. URHA0020]